MHITRAAVNDLAKAKNLRFDGPGFRLDGYDFYVFLNTPSGTPTFKQVLQSFDIGDVCRFLGLDGVTQFENHRPRPRAPTIRIEYGPEGSRRIEGPITQPYLG
jgi:hypothetical protein